MRFKFFITFAFLVVTVQAQAKGLCFHFFNNIAESQSKSLLSETPKVNFENKNLIEYGLLSSNISYYYQLVSQGFNFNLRYNFKIKPNYTLQVHPLQVAVLSRNLNVVKNHLMFVSKLPRDLFYEDDLLELGLPENLFYGEVGQRIAYLSPYDLSTDETKKYLASFLNLKMPQELAFMKLKLHPVSQAALNNDLEALEILLNHFKKRPHIYKVPKSLESSKSPKVNLVDYTVIQILDFIKNADLEDSKTKSLLKIYFQRLEILTSYGGLISKDLKKKLKLKSKGLHLIYSDI